MIHGVVNADDIPTVTLHIAGQDWPAIIDTGFNGDLELPEALRAHVNPRFVAQIRSQLAGGQTIVEDSYLVDFPFDGGVVQADATFVAGTGLLLGTHLLRQYRLTIDFVARTVLLERLP